MGRHVRLDTDPPDPPKAAADDDYGSSNDDAAARSLVELTREERLVGFLVYLLLLLLVLLVCHLLDPAHTWRWFLLVGGVMKVGSASVADAYVSRRPPWPAPDAKGRGRLLRLVEVSLRPLTSVDHGLNRAVSRSWLPVVGGVVVAGVGVLFVVVGVIGDRDQRQLGTQLRAEGVSAPGVVVSVEYDDDQHDDVTAVTVRFGGANGITEDLSRVEGLPHGLRSGDPVRVTYLPEEPDVALLSSQLDDHLVTGDHVQIAVGVLVLLGGLAWPALRARRRRR